MLSVPPSRLLLLPLAAGFAQTLACDPHPDPSLRAILSQTPPTSALSVDEHRALGPARWELEVLKTTAMRGETPPGSGAFVCRRLAAGDPAHALVLWSDNRPLMMVIEHDINRPATPPIPAAGAARGGCTPTCGGVRCSASGVSAWWPAEGRQSVIQHQRLLAARPHLRPELSDYAHLSYGACSPVIGPPSARAAWPLDGC